MQRFCLQTRRVDVRVRACVRACVCVHITCTYYYEVLDVGSLRPAARQWHNNDEEDGGDDDNDDDDDDGWLLTKVEEIASCQKDVLLSSRPAVNSPVATNKTVSAQ